MSRLRLFMVLAGILCLAPPLFAQVQTRCIDLTFTDPPTDPLDNPFGLALDPNGQTLYVAISGGLGGTENSLVAAVDLASSSVVQRERVGFYPEELAIQTDATGQLLYLYVTSSSSNQVDVLDASFRHLRTIPLPPEPNFGTWFPFSLLLSKDQTRLYVSTVEGSGNVFVIDTDVANPNGTFHQELPGERFLVPGGHGRLAWAPDDQRIIVPVTIFYSDFSGSDALLTWIDPAQPSSSSSVLLAAGGAYPSPADTAQTRDEILYASVNSGPSRLYALDARTGDLLTTIELGGLGGEYGLTLDPTGTFLYVTDLFIGDVYILDTRDESLVGIFSAGTSANDVAFTQDGSRAFVSDQGSQCLIEATRLPRAELVLEGTSLPMNGGMASYLVSGGTQGRPVTLYGSLVGPGPTSIGGHVVDLSAPVVPLLFGAFDLRGEASLGPATIPAGSQYVGLNVFLQAATVEVDGRLLLSNPFTAIVQ
ncbi:MAG: hypothetical protein RL885_00470 [Planctomycetota bacterium]